MVSDSPADTIAQWFNAGGMIDYYDYPLDVYLNVRLLRTMRFLGLHTT
jgi:hypothetical protein